MRRDIVEPAQHSAYQPEVTETQRELRPAGAKMTVAGEPPGGGAAKMTATLALADARSRSTTRLSARPRATV
jgi:hypothetical protein